MILLGYDIGSSSVKASLVEAESGQCIASAFYPKHEAPIISHQAGWAEQNPDDWWEYLRQANQYSVFRNQMKKIMLIVAVAAGAALLTGCNVTRTVTTKSEYWQKSDTSCVIQTKTIESYDASKKLPY